MPFGSVIEFRINLKNLLIPSTNRSAGNFNCRQGAVLLAQSITKGIRILKIRMIRGAFHYFGSTLVDSASTSHRTCHSSLPTARHATQATCYTGNMLPSTLLGSITMVPRRDTMLISFRAAFFARFGLPFQREYWESHLRPFFQ